MKNQFKILNEVIVIKFESHSIACEKFSFLQFGLNRSLSLCMLTYFISYSLLKVHELFILFKNFFLKNI